MARRRLHVSQQGRQKHHGGQQDTETARPGYKPQTEDASMMRYHQGTKPHSRAQGR